MANDASGDAPMELTEALRRLGAADPESWGASQSTEGTLAFARFVFLRRAWSHVVDEGDDSWIDRLAADPGGDVSLGAIGPALRRMLDAGVARSDIVDVVRGSQYETLFGLCDQLDDCHVDFLEDGMPPVAWGLFQLDEDWKPIKPIDGLHEDLLQIDPTGREMRARPMT